MLKISTLIKNLELGREVSLKACARLGIPLDSINNSVSPKTFKSILETMISILGDPNKDNLDKSTRHLIAELKIEHNAFTRKKTLKLESLNLTAIPEKIFDLVHLQVLDLSNNQIKNIPDEILKLINLKVLIAYRNQLESLPEALQRLPNLKKIILHHNQISIIPQGHLPQSLKWLGLSNNNIKHIPFVIFELVQLERLWLCDNSIDDLPQEMHDYLQRTSSFRAIYLLGNPLKKIPIYAWKGNQISRVKNYLSAAYKGTIINYEAKIILVGNGNEGKTTLRKRLNNLNYQPIETERTDKIEIEEMDFAINSDKLNLNLNMPINEQGIYLEPVYKAKVWDFGGQEIQRNIHTFFLTDNALYLLLWSVRQSEDKYANLKHWLNVIKSHSPKSKVVIILNKAFDDAGKLIKQESEFLNEEAIKKAFPNNVIDFLEISALYGKGVEGENGLRERIRKYLPMLEKVGQELPISWFKLKEKLVHLSTLHAYIEIEDFQKQYLQDVDFLDLKRDEFHDIIAWLVNIGVVLHYPKNSRLSRYLFLKPEWIIKPIYEVLLDGKGITKKNKGRFNYGNFGLLCTLEKSSDRDIIIQLLSEFNLCVSIDDNDNQEQFVIPQLLDEISEKELVEHSMAKDYRIQYEYHYEYQPKGMLNRIIAECQKRGLVKDSLLWSNAVIIKDSDGNEAIIYSQVLSRDKIIIRIKGNEGFSLLAIIRNMFGYKYIHAILESESVACNCLTCRNHANPALYERSTLEDMHKKDKLQVQCTRSYDMIEISGLIGISGGDRKTRSEEAGGIIIHQNTIHQNNSIIKDQIANSNLSARDVNVGNKSKDQE